MVLPPTTVSQRILRRVGLVGDIHCEDQLLELVLRHLATEGTDTILSVGDVVDGVGDVNRACDLLVEHAVFTVRGNHDRWILQGAMRDLRDATPASALRGEVREWLGGLPKTLSFQTPKGALLLCHGLGEDDMAELRPHDTGYSLESNLPLAALMKSKLYRFVVNGHTHEPMVRTIGLLTIINTGTLARGCRQTCSVMDFEGRTVEFFDAAGGHIAKAEQFLLA